MSDEDGWPGVTMAVVAFGVSAVPSPPPLSGEFRAPEDEHAAADAARSTPIITAMAVRPEAP